MIDWQEGLDKVNKSRVKGVMDQILADVSKTADELEELLSENLFDAAVKEVVCAILCVSFSAAFTVNR